MTATYRPRMAAQITLPSVAGTAAQAAGWFDPTNITFPLRVQSAELVQNDPHAADELKLVVDYNDGGVDPRILAGGVIAFWMDNADDFGNWTPSNANTRFMGRISKAGRKLGGDSASLVELECLDYTSFFLTTKPIRTDAVPTFAMHLDEAWALLCANVPGASTLASNITFQGLGGNIPKIGDAVAPRFRAAGKPVVRVEEDAWAIWAQLCGSLGLMTYIFLDQCIVTTALDYYTADDPPILIYGQNILHLAEERHNDFDRKGVGVTSFDPLSGTTLESVYPPHGDARVQPRHMPAKTRTAKASGKGGGGGPKKDPEKYDYFAVQGVTDQATLDQIAQYTYEVRSKQEMQGTLTTAEMSIDTLSADTFDLLTLRSGDLIKVQVGEIDALGAKILASLPTVAARTSYFLAKGYSIGFAQLLAENLQQLVSLRQEFYVKAVATKLSADETGGTFEIEIHYVNKIVASGSTENQAGTEA